LTPTIWLGLEVPDEHPVTKLITQTVDNAIKDTDIKDARNDGAFALLVIKHLQGF
jgi:hypothetical protein